MLTHTYVYKVTHKGCLGAQRARVLHACEGELCGMSGAAWQGIDNSTNRINQSLTVFSLPLVTQCIKLFKV